MNRTVFLWINILILFFVAQLGGQKIFVPPNNKVVNSDYHYLNCSSDNFNYRECFAGGTITHVSIYLSKSNVSCLYRKNWGYFADRLWVDQGCKAIFQYELQQELGMNSALSATTIALK